MWRRLDAPQHDADTRLSGLETRMPLKVMTAGCDDGEKSRLESLVRAAIGDRSERGNWSVSLVRIGTKLSTRLEGPSPALRDVSFMVTEEQLQESLLGALRDAGLVTPHDESGAEGPTPNETQRNAHVCGTCANAFVVLFESFPEEAERTVPVACPHCWQLNRVPVGQWAAEGEEYRAEKA
jgi:hypothetical protein